MTDQDPRDPRTWPAPGSPPPSLTGPSMYPADVVTTDRLKAIAAAPPVKPSKLVIDGFVTIHADGTVEFPEGVTPNEAAEAFWKAVEEMRPW